MIKKVRGTQDKLDLKLQNFILNQIKKHLECYNFSQIETPILEQTKLFVHTLGEQTDVVCKEMYTFDSSPQKENSICLRPEATASTIRAYIENKIEEKPWKVFSYGPMFRRERPQKGRWREFWQINIEVINSDSIAQDANFIKMLDRFFSEYLKLEDYVIKLNFLGCLKDRNEHREKLYEFLEKSKSTICSTCTQRKEKNILRIFDCKEESCKKIYLNAPKLIDFLCKDCKNEWDQLQETLQILSVSHIHDPFLVRGLDYYNKTVFEFCSKELGAQDAFCGGGRYILGKTIGSKENYPSVGTGIGLGRLLLLVQKIEKQLTIPQPKTLHLILPMSQDQQSLALLLSDELQSNDLCTDVLLEGASLKNMMRKANKMGTKYVLILGEDEQKNNTVSIKNMQTGKSTIIKQNQVINYLHNKKI
ncbi:histidine--tRNA ligase [Candidatus Babeliales bacterium]|nr:histidine--tRNA ligase [Candidatus Babeliales bacterium]